MARYQYTLTAETPVSAGKSDQRANVRQAHRVLPGATVRGALAASWLRSNDTANPPVADQFNRLFEQGMIVGQAVPVDFELLSASSLICKYRPKEPCREMLLDQVFDAGISPTSKCPECNGPLAAARGWRQVPGQSQTSIISRTRGALTKRETAAEGKLFTRHAVSGAQGQTKAVFEGCLILPDGVSTTELPKQVRVGGGRSLDYGRSKFELSESGWPELPDAEKHVLRIVSPAILIDDYGAPCLTVAGLQTELRRVGGDAGLSLTAEPGWLRSESVSGWHMASRLPKALDWALEPGSVVIVTGLTAMGWANLASGIGLRTLEGYGQIEIADDPETRTKKRPVARAQMVAEPAAQQPVDAQEPPRAVQSAPAPVPAAMPAQGPPTPSQAPDSESVATPAVTPSATEPDPGAASVAAPGIEESKDAEPPAIDTDNLGVQRLKKLRPRIKKQNQWLGVKRQLLASLKNLLDSPQADHDAIRAAARFNDLMVADRAAADSVLAIPISHIPGTIAKLEAMK